MHPSVTLRNRCASRMDTARAPDRIWAWGEDAWGRLTQTGLVLTWASLVQAGGMRRAVRTPRSAARTVRTAAARAGQRGAGRGRGGSGDGPPRGAPAAEPGPPPAEARAPLPGRGDRAAARAGHHPGRKKKILAWTAGGVAVVVLLALGGAYAVYRHLNGNIHQLDISGELGSQPVDTHPQAENIMIIGSDTRNGQGRGFGQNLNTDQSDTLMIMHIAADRKWVNVMSIPRDSWVNIPACKMGNGQTSAPTTFKINEAFALGNLDGNHTDLGVACTIKTLEQDTGIHIDHFVSINFQGFRDMVNALGGVEECNTTSDQRPEVRLVSSSPAIISCMAWGRWLMSGPATPWATAAIWSGSAASRPSCPRSWSRVKSKRLNPIAIYNFLNAATKSITIDSQLGGIHGLYDLAMSVRNLPASQVTFFTLPTYPRQLVVPTDTANVMWTQPVDSTIFQDFRNDIPVSHAAVQQARKPRMSPHTVSVLVRNGTAQYGLQDSVGSAAAAAGLQRDRHDPGGGAGRHRDGDQVPRGPRGTGQAAGGQGARLRRPGGPGQQRRARAPAGQ